MRKAVLFFAIVAITFQPRIASAQHPNFQDMGDTIQVYNTFTYAPDGQKLYTSEPHRIENPDGDGVILPRWGPKERPWVTMFEYDMDENNLPINRRKLSFANDSLDSSPHINYEGNRLYYNSRNPVPGSDELDGVMHVWYSEKGEDNTWSEPQFIEAINRKGYYSSYAQELSDGSIIFQSNIPGGVNDADGNPTQDLWMSVPKNGEYQAPINLKELNSEIHEDQLVVNRNSDLIIFSRFDETDMYLFYSTKRDGQWTEPIELFVTDQAGFTEQSPRLSLDENHFCFAHGFTIMCTPLEELLKMTEEY